MKVVSLKPNAVIELTVNLIVYLLPGSRDPGLRPRLGLDGSEIYNISKIHI